MVEGVRDWNAHVVRNGKLGFFINQPFLIFYSGNQACSSELSVLWPSLLWVITALLVSLFFCFVSDVTVKLLPNDSIPCIITGPRLKSRFQLKWLLSFDLGFYSGGLACMWGDVICFWASSSRNNAHMELLYFTGPGIQTCNWKGAGGDATGCQSSMLAQNVVVVNYYSEIYMLVN